MWGYRRPRNGVGAHRRGRRAAVGGSWWFVRCPVTEKQGRARAPLKYALERLLLILHKETGKSITVLFPFHNNDLHFIPVGVLCLLSETGIYCSFMPFLRYFTSFFICKPVRYISAEATSDTSDWKTVGLRSTVGRGESLFVSQEATIWTKFCRRR